MDYIWIVFFFLSNNWIELYIEYYEFCKSYKTHQLIQYIPIVVQKILILCNM